MMTRTMWGAALGALALATTAAAQSNGGQVCMDPCQLCMQKIQAGASGGVYDNACSQCDRQRAHARQQGTNAAPQAMQGSAPSAQSQGTGSAQPPQESGTAPLPQGGSQGGLASQGSTLPPAGGDVRASLDQAAQNLSNSASGAASDIRSGLDQLDTPRGGIGASGYRMNTVITDVIGTFNGEGLNAEYQRPIAEHISGVVGANYSRTSSTTGNLTAFGGEVGADYFPFTYAGQGFRVGPRLALDFGQESVDHTRYFTDFGIGGEAGYNWQLSSGLSFQLAAGIGGRVGGALTSGLDTRLGGDFGPYGKVNVGWSW